MNIITKCVLKIELVISFKVKGIKIKKNLAIIYLVFCIDILKLSMKISIERNYKR